MRGEYNQYWPIRGWHCTSLGHSAWTIPIARGVFCKNEHSIKAQILWTLRPFITWTDSHSTIPIIRNQNQKLLITVLTSSAQFFKILLENIWNLSLICQRWWHGFLLAMHFSMRSKFWIILTIICLHQNLKEIHDRVVHDHAPIDVSIWNILLVCLPKKSLTH